MPGPIFPRVEFQRRYERAWTMMAKSGLQALIAYSPGNQFWLTGFRGSSGGRRFAEYVHHVIMPKVILPLEREPVIVGLKIAAGGYELETFVRDIRPVISPLRERPRMIRDALVGLGMSGVRIGMDLGAFDGIAPGELDSLRQELAGSQLIDASGIFWRLRMIKSAAEIAYLRKAVEIQNQAFRRFVGRIGFGMSEAELIFTMIQCQAESGASEIGMALASSHPAAAFFGAQAADRVMQPGDLQWFDAGATYLGYTCDYDTLIAWGGVTADQRKTFAMVKEIYEEAIEAWKPGRRVREIAQDVARIIHAHRGTDPLEGNFMGHSLGYELVERPWFGVHAPSDLILEPDMVISPEWFIATEHGPLLYEKNFLVTKSGLEQLSDFGSEIQVIDH